ncbi:MAG: hypothetical protein LBQ90_04300 [Synergistaceae bacterium]|jgi:hypothetical protein|nr:hypothetical protein [Synergistaceae bacterium]
MQDTVTVSADDELIDVSKEKKVGARKNYDAWDYALGMIKVDGLTPSSDFLALVERERCGEITTADIKKYLDKKYRVRERG